MRVWIAGIDGYLGWAFAQVLTQRGHTVGGADAGLRREWVAEIGGDSAIPIADIQQRQHTFTEHYGQSLDWRTGNLTDTNFVYEFIAEFQPDTIVHLGQMPSAPYSMMDAQHAIWTQQNNITSTLNILWAMQACCPTAHLVKLGTMGEYGTPNVDIPEGTFEINYRGRRATLPFPRQAGSFYHLSKVHDSHNTEFACRVWGLRATDIMQGIVFGTRFDDMSDHPHLRTRLDFDQCFGTVMNRFCCQAVIGHPLTLFGTGEQIRSFLPLRDAMQCLTLVIENPADTGEYRMLNQFEGVYSIVALANKVMQASDKLGLNVEIAHYDNPREEAETHYYNPDRQKLLDLGYQPTDDIQSEIESLLTDLIPHADRIRQHQACLIPNIHWNGKHHRTQPRAMIPLCELD